MPPISVVIVAGHSGDRSRQFARLGKKDGVAKGIDQHRPHRLGQRKDAGRILERAGSTSDLKSHSTVALLGHEIYAIGSLGDIDVQ